MWAEFEVTRNGMGAAISTVRDEINNNDKPDDKRREKQERLKILEKMVNGQLDKQQRHTIAGVRGDQEIYSGTIVQEYRQINIVSREHGSENVQGTVDSILDGTSKCIVGEGNLKTFFESTMHGLGKLLHGSLDAVVGNSSIGEYEADSMFIVWTNNALLRCDAYYYRWNFASRGIMDDVEGVIGVFLLKRVIDITKTDPQVLTWAISRQAHALGRGDEAPQMIEEAMEVVKKVSLFQKEVKAMQNGH